MNSDSPLKQKLNPNNGQGYALLDVEGPPNNANQKGNPFSNYQPIDQYGNARNTNQTHTQSGYPNMTTQQMPNQGFANQTSSAVETLPINIKIPKICHEQCFSRLFPRKVPRQPAQMFCQVCDRNVNTLVSDEIGLGLIGCTAGLFCCATLLCWLPFCLQDCYDIEHRCSQCGVVIAKERFLRP